MNTKGTIQEAVTRFEDYTRTSTRLSLSTRRRYADVVRLCAAALRQNRLEDITPVLLLEWKEWMVNQDMAWGTINQKPAAVRSFLRSMDEFEENDQARSSCGPSPRPRAPGERCQGMVDDARTGLCDIPVTGSTDGLFREREWSMSRTMAAQP